MADEVPVAISFNGSSHAVLMATPRDLADLGPGFALSEGIIASHAEIEACEVVTAGEGFDVQMRLVADRSEALRQRKRFMAGPTGCGLCGIESLEEAMRALPDVQSSVRLQPHDVGLAVADLARLQVLNRETRSVHAAGYFVPGKGMIAVREDVGRHNALDKLVGAMASEGRDLADGVIVMSSRISVELVQKAALARCGMFIAVSAPTALAIRTAEAAGITLIGIARGEDFEVFTRPDRIEDGVESHVA